MRKAVWLASVGVTVLASSASAQASAPPPETVEAARTSVPTDPLRVASAAGFARYGVLVFEPAFFADARPDTALDMTARLPGFNLDTGDSGTRGLAGTAGDVLIGGPSKKGGTARSRPSCL